MSPGELVAQRGLKPRSPDAESHTCPFRVCHLLLILRVLLHWEWGGCFWMGQSTMGRCWDAEILWEGGISSLWMDVLRRLERESK